MFIVTPRPCAVGAFFLFFSMDNFQYALQKTLRWEGGYQNSEADPGNYNSRGELIGTNLGISAPVLEKHLGCVPTVDDMKALTHETAAEIYRGYWQAVRAGEILNRDLAALLFDMAVNHGPSSAIRTAQRAVRVKADGKIGPVTLAALNRSNATKTITQIVEARVNLYRRIIERRPQMQVFHRGWIKRALSFLPK